MSEDKKSATRTPTAARWCDHVPVMHARRQRSLRPVEAFSPACYSSGGGRRPIMGQRHHHGWNKVPGLDWISVYMRHAWEAPPTPFFSFFFSFSLLLLVFLFFFLACFSPLLSLDKEGEKEATSLKAKVGIVVIINSGGHKTWWWWWWLFMGFIVRSSSRRWLSWLPPSCCSTMWWWYGGGMVEKLGESQCALECRVCP